MIYRIVRFILRVYFGLLYRLEVKGLENIPADGPVILCANHISLKDPPVVGIPLDRKVHYMAKEELFRIPGFGWLIKQLGAFPVKRGGVSKESIRNAIGLLKNNHVMGIFPEGTRKNPGGMGKKGASMLALKSNATVIPVAVVGDYTLFRKMRVYYGKPIDLSPYKEGGSDQLEAATEAIMQTIRAMVAEHKNDRKN
ncbi:1-acyl-sn-glycerol-3-phosphate acyltransferase [Paenibacillus sp. J31TS4]|uniref:lysophospholipid acyltransferase family protein n=1 Tax=Paenibacillus sp. J31TS4 TaxID=2807195 RepID=UPI001B2D8BD3|nr:lysophospholipid acyltransferase family protein [Paenibacillus sp. J31TS4]GIP37493.1 1-acyl-sn-glycerol-3-phosphate acyltransferase [Paenibacillus sp. J31TS4]